MQLSNKNRSEFANIALQFIDAFDTGFTPELTYVIEHRPDCSLCIIIKPCPQAFAELFSGGQIVMYSAWQNKPPYVNLPFTRAGYIQGLKSAIADAESRGQKRKAADYKILLKSQYEILS